MTTLYKFHNAYLIQDFLESYIRKTFPNKPYNETQTCALRRPVQCLS